jgi:hypothetical protein
MKSVTYVGSFDAVEIETAPGLWATVANGDALSVADRIADGLLEQSDSWVEAKAPARKTATKEA